MLTIYKASAGSGKTYTAIALAVRALREKTVRRVILTRPAVEAGEKLGFLPGDMKEKLDPYLQPLYDALNDMIPPLKLQKLLEEGTVGLYLPEDVRPLGVGYTPVWGTPYNIAES